MRMILGIVCGVCVAVSAAADNHGYGDLASVFGGTDAQSCSGNGGLTVCANAYGQITVCFWPSPSYFDQLAYRRLTWESQPETGRGVMWGVRLPGRTIWLAGPPWTIKPGTLEVRPNIIETDLTLPEPSLSAQQVTFVCPGKDILVMHLRVSGARVPFRVYWYADYSPCTRLVPEAPIADWVLNAVNDFAVFADRRQHTVYHFRPKNPGQGDWERAEKLSKSHASLKAWSRFSDGAWIGCRGDRVETSFQCGADGSASSAFRQACAGDLVGTESSVGQCDEAMAWPLVRAPSSSFAVTVYSAFGRSEAQTGAALDYAVKTGYDRLLQDAQDYWNHWLAKATMPADKDPELSSLTRQCLVVLADAMDRNSGGMVRAPVAPPPLALDWAKNGAWMTMALDMAGYHNLAEKHTLFYLDCQRKDATKGRPMGSLPGASYTNHVEGLPHVMLEEDATAWMLWSFWQHASTLTGKARLVYLKKVWEATNRGGDFLAGWVNDRTGDPFPSFSVDYWRDASTKDQTPIVLGGLGAAVSIARTLGKDRPSWDNRMKSMRASVQYRFLDVYQKWKISNPLPYWFLGIVPLADSRWDAPITKALAALPTLKWDAAAVSLCDLALACKGRPEDLARLRPLVKPAMARALTGADVKVSSVPVFPDALRAAQCVIAAETVYSN